MHLLMATLVFLAGVSCVVGIYHLFVFFQNRSHRPALAIAALCLTSCAYNMACAGLYFAATPTGGLFWQTLQLTLLAVHMPVLLWVVYEVASRRFGLFEYLLLGFAAAYLFVVHGVGSGLALCVDCPPIMQAFELPGWSGISFYEYAWGPWTTVSASLSLLVIVWSLHVLWSSRTRNDSITKPIFWTLALYLATCMNDTLFGLNIIGGMYLGEYGSMAFVLVAAFVSAGEAAQFPRVRASRDRMQVIMDVAPLGLQVFRRNPDGSMELVHSNAYADRILRLSCGGVCESAMAQIRQQVSRAEAEWQFGQREQGNSVIEKEIVIRGDGTIACTLELLILKADDRHVAVSIRDVTDRKALERRLLSIGESEMLRIGADLHDTVAQQLSGLSLLAAGLRDRLSAESHSEVAAVASLYRTLAQALTDTRRIMSGLSFQFGENDLPEAIQALARYVTHSQGVLCTVQCHGTNVRLDDSTSLNLFRIVQECVANAVRHARAQHIHITLTLHPEICVIVRDDGVGIEAAVGGRKGFGLKIMKYRAELIGASLDVIGGADEGTSVTCRLPVFGVRDLAVNERDATCKQQSRTRLNKEKFDF